MKKIIAIIIVAASGFLTGGAAFAGGEGTASGVFLTLPSGPGMAALGGPGAVAGGPSALYNNPAGLAGVRRVSSELSHAAWLEGLNYNIFSVAIPVRIGEVAAIGVRYMGYGNIDSVDNTGVDAGNIAPRDMAITAGYSGTFADGWSAGVAGKYIDSRIAASAYAFALDGGLQYRRGRLAIGLAAVNMGGKLKYADEAYPLPFSVNGGVSCKVADGWTLFVERDVPRSGSARAGGGAERSFQFSEDLEFTARGGYTTRYSRTGGVNGLSGGLGFAFKEFTFDYAFNAVGELGLTHHFGIGLRWGGGHASDKERSYMSALR